MSQIDSTTEQRYADMDNMLNQYPAPIGPRPVTVLDQVAAFIRTYVALPTYNEALVLAAWVVHTHAFEISYATPYIYINSAEPECGKTLLLETLEFVARNATLSSSLTPSTLYRRMGSDTARPTLLIDEVDALFSGSKNETMRGILNSGYQHKGTMSITLPGKSEDGSDVVDFPTFCPKILAGIDNGQLPPTLSSRAITITLQRKAPNQHVSRFLARKVEKVAEVLKADISEWVAAHINLMEDYEPEFVDGISDRAFQITEPLLQIAHEAGIEDELRAALQALLIAPKTLTQGQQVLIAARDHFQNNGVDRVTTKTLETVTGYNGKLIGSLLSKYDIKSTTLNKGSHGLTANAKGYYLRDMKDAIERYI